MKPPKQTKADVLRAFREQRYNDGVNLLHKAQKQKEKKKKKKTKRK